LKKAGGGSLFGAIKEDVFAQTLGASHKDSVGDFPEDIYPCTAGIASSSKQHSTKANGGAFTGTRLLRLLGASGGFAGLLDRICPTFRWGRW
jgi:hypothetical protein